MSREAFRSADQQAESGTKPQFYLGPLPGEKPRLDYIDQLFNLKAIRPEDTEP